MNREPAFTTVRDLAGSRSKSLYAETIPGCHLHYNAPGDSGFGIKRTSLLIPESVLLMVSPACCGRHATVAGLETGFGDRICYLQMNERELVTGKHLQKISQAVTEICEAFDPRPKAVIVCVTCVDGLLGTDLERVCRQARSECKIPVIPAYMQPITRESKRPPMVTIHRTLYHCLEPMDKKDNTVNLLGGFVPLDDDSELPVLLRQAGIDRIGQISACRTFEEYLEMSRSKLNLVINPQAMLAAEDLRRRLDTPYCRIRLLYALEGIREQYRLLGEMLGIKFDDGIYYAEAAEALARFQQRHAGMRFAVGETVSGNPFEMSLALIQYGFPVPIIFRHVISEEDKPYIERLGMISPDTRVFSGVNPSMLNFDYETADADAAIGLDAGCYLKKTVCTAWNMERQTFGYRGLTALFSQIEQDFAHPESPLAQMHGSYLVL